MSNLTDGYDYDMRKLYKFVKNEKKELAIVLTDVAGKYAGVIFTVDFENAKVVETEENGDSRFEFSYQIVHTNNLPDLEKDADLANIVGVIFTDILKSLVEEMNKENLEELQDTADEKD